jgi:hypothetical protein
VLVGKAVLTEVTKEAIGIAKKLPKKPSKYEVMIARALAGGGNDEVGGSDCPALEVEVCGYGSAGPVGYAVR